MLCRAVPVALACAYLFSTAVLAREPLFDSQPGHPWNQARDAFYVRRFSTGEIFEHPHATTPPWHEYTRFAFDATVHESVCARLDAVENLPRAQMEEQPPLRRVIFLRDLWAAFDGLEQLHMGLILRQDDDEALKKAIVRSDELRSRLARVMKRLELSDEEVRTLPDAITIVSEKALYPKSFDPARGDKAFFPSELLDQNGPWLTYSSEQEPSIGGTVHTKFADHRSIFTLHLRAPDGRAGGLKFFQDYIRADRRLQIPPGSTLALLNRAVVPTRSGKLLVSPLVESLQMIVVTPPEDHRFKFMIDRKELLAGNLGLKSLGQDDPADFSSFSGVALWGHAVDPRKFDVDGNTFIAGKYNNIRDMPREMNVCVRCHRETLGTVVISRGGAPLPYVQSDLEKADTTVLKQKESSDEWKSYLRLRAAKAK